MAETIDAHHHLWQYTKADYGWISEEMGALKRDFLPGDLEREMADTGVDGAVVVQARQSLTETRWLLDCAVKSEAIRGVVGWVPLAAGDLADVLDGLRGSGKLKGVRHVIQDEPDDRFILREDFNAGITSLLGTGLVYDILIHERHLPHVVEFVQRHPKQVFVLDHLAKPRIQAQEIEPWRSNLLRLAAEENVYCKLSGMVTEAAWATWTLEDLRPYLDAALEAFGAERLMVGSDWPVCLVASGYTRWWETMREWARPLSDAQKTNLFGETAKRAYRL